MGTLSIVATAIQMFGLVTASQYVLWSSICFSLMTHSAYLLRSRDSAVVHTRSAGASIDVRARHLSSKTLILIVSTLAPAG